MRRGEFDFSSIFMGEGECSYPHKNIQLYYIGGNHGSGGEAIHPLTHKTDIDPKVSKETHCRSISERLKFLRNL